MFSRTARSAIARQTEVALSLARSFLLLEDDVHVDWEVDRQEWTASEHPHRALRKPRSRVVRRAGQPRPAPQECLCPIRRGAPRDRQHA